MNITFLVGNGFDLNLGLKTTFSSFLKYYTKSITNDSLSILNFKTHILKDKKLWSDAEMAFGAYTAVFKEEGKNADDFYECYDDFCEKLADYLQKQENRIDFNAQGKLVVEAFSKSIEINNILSHFSEVQQEQINSAIAKVGDGFSYRFIDFNYTTTLDACVILTKRGNVLGNRTIGNTHYANSISNLIHVHGYTSRNMVLGVNDANQLADKEIFSGYGDEYIDQMIKVKANGLNEENTDRKAARIVKASDLIYIYGMSLGDTDKLWWERIIQRMTEQPSVHLIIHSHNGPKTQLLPRKKHTWIREMKNRFIGISGIELSDEQRKSVFDRIHIDCENIFEPLKALTVSTDEKENEELTTASLT